MEKKTLTLSTESSKLFFGEEGMGIARYDKVRYPVFTKMNEKMKSFFWQPVEVDVSNERACFRKMSEAEQFTFTSNLSRQIILDTVQARAPALAFLPHCTDPALEGCILTWSFFEQIHSESYTHIIRSIYSDPSEVYEAIPNIEEVVDCAKSITKSYDDLQNNPNEETLLLGLHSANALEALRFYVSFGCSFSLGERGLMEGSAKIIKLIARDEQQHLALGSHVIKTLSKDDPIYTQIAGDRHKDIVNIYEEAAEQEKEWAKYLFSKGSILGLNENILNEYVDYLLVKRKFAMGLSSTNKGKQDHPIPWVEKWYSNANTQVAPQEVELSGYLTSTVKDDLKDAEFSL